MLFWVQIATKGHVDLLFPAFYKLIVSLFTLYWTCLLLLFTDTKYYLTNQVHPVISRLCDPIEGTDAAHLAECLGKYNKYNTTVVHFKQDSRIGGVMVSMLASSAVDRGFKPQSGKTKD